MDDIPIYGVVHNDVTAFNFACFTDDHPKHVACARTPFAGGGPSTSIALSNQTWTMRVPEPRRAYIRFSATIC